MMNQPLPSDPTADRALIEVEGPDAGAFLNSLLTQGVGADAGAGGQTGALYGAFLSPQGKVLFDLFVLSRGPQAFWLDVAADRADLALARLKPFKLGRKVALAPLPAWFGRWVEGQGDDCACGACLSVVDPRSPAAPLGRRRYGTIGCAVGAAVSQGARLSAGVPDLSVDCGVEEMFALEGLLQELGGVDFHKGCFPGQENVSRMKRRATTRKKLCRVRFEGAPAQFGSVITAGGAELGVLRTATSGVGLGYIRLDRAREALAAGETLTCAGKPIHLDAPDWLIWPAQGEES
jgi:tRNA-modifying protein YgfZ